MRTTGRPHVCVWSRRKLAAPEWQGKGSYPQRDCDLHANSLLIDLHLIWPLKLVEGSHRTGRERQAPSEVSPLLAVTSCRERESLIRWPFTPRRGPPWRDNVTFSLAKQQLRFVRLVPNNSSSVYKSCLKSFNRPTDSCKAKWLFNPHPCFM